LRPENIYLLQKQRSKTKHENSRKAAWGQDKKSAGRFGCSSGFPAGTPERYQSSRL